MALITKKGLESLKIQLRNELENEKEALEAVAVARGFGDFSENAELDAAKIDLKRTQDAIFRIKKDISSAEIFNVENASKDKIEFGATVILEDDNENKFEYTLLSNSESDISKKILSVNSPLAQSMIGKSVGDSFSFYPPAGEKTYEIISIKYDSNLLK